MKKFDRSLYNQYDQMAKNGAIKYLLESGAQMVFPSESRYGVDLQYRQADGAPDRLMEAEVKLTWGSGPGFPYPTINVLTRKTKFFIRGASLFMLAKNARDYLVIDSETVLKAPMEEVRNKYVPQGEAFYKVPISQAVFGCFMSPVDSTPPDCPDCGKWFGLLKTDHGASCLKCGALYEQ